MSTLMKAPPQFISSTKTYAQWVTEVELWSEVTDIAKAKQGTTVALSLPDEDDLFKLNIRERVINEMDLTKLRAETGVQELLTFLNPIYKQDDLTAAYDSWSDFENLKRTQGMLIEEFISEYQKLNNHICKQKIVLPEAVLAFKLLDSSGLDHTDRKLVLTGVDYTKENTLFTQMCAALRTFFGKIALKSTKDGVQVKAEPTFCSDTFYSSSGRGRGKNVHKFQSHSTYQRPKHEKPKARNPMGRDGEPLRCHKCGSWNHLARSCPDNTNQSDSSQAEEVEDCAVVLWNNLESSSLIRPHRNCAILDTACSSTVCGEEWLENYISSLDASDKKNIITKPTERKFKFGSGCILKSKKYVILPCYIGGSKVQIATDVIESKLPLLMSKPSLKRAEIVMDVKIDRVSAFGRRLKLLPSPSDHYVISLGKEPDVQDVFVTFFKGNELSRDDISKLHRQ